jgi:hypothetical protein
MWKIVTSSTFALLVAYATPIGSAIAQTPQPAARAAIQPATATPRYRRIRYAARQRWRRHAYGCFASEWRPFPTRDPNGYFYAPPGGGIC